MPAVKCDEVDDLCRAFVSLNDDIPTSYLPDWMPGMIVSKVAFTNFQVRPMTLPSACPSSGSHPVTVLPLEPMNSFGAYVASAATVSVPFDLTFAGTSAAILLFAPPALAGVALVVVLALVVVAVVELLPFLAPPHPVATTTTSATLRTLPRSVFVRYRMAVPSYGRAGRQRSRRLVEPKS